MPTQSFRQRFEVRVPGRSPIGGSPSREETFRFVLPDGIQIVRQGANFGAIVVDANYGGLTERRREFREIDNGVELVWKLVNGEVFPVTGRHAWIDVEVHGESTISMSLSSKYQILRQRFFDRFFFDGLVAEYIDPSVHGGRIKFADQTIYMGQTLMAMSTEAAILRTIGGDKTDTLDRIRTILNAINQLDVAAEPYFGESAALNGFFLRDNVTGPGDSRLRGRFAVCDSDSQNPPAENASPSGDQIFGMLYGLSMVVHFAGDNGLATQAKDISSRLFDYARRNRFVLRLPSGAPTRRGSDMRWLSSLLHGLNMDTTGQDLFNQSTIELSGDTKPLTGIAAVWDDPVTAKLIESLAGQEFIVPIIDQKVKLNSFALHIILTALAPADVWSQEELEGLAQKTNHHVSVLVYCLRHKGRLPQYFNKEDVDQILEFCPDTGPADSLSPGTGWNKDNRWIRSSNLGESHTGGPEEYNGIDWLLLHNLNQLVFLRS
jgi:hypothetical protein